MAWPLGTRAWHSVTFTPLCRELDIIVIAVVAQFSKYQNDFLDLLGMRTEFLGSVKLWRLSAACAARSSFISRDIRVSRMWWMVAARMGWTLEFLCNHHWTDGSTFIASSAASPHFQSDSKVVSRSHLPEAPPPRGPLQLFAFAVIRLIRLKWVKSTDLSCSVMWVM